MQGKSKLRCVCVRASGVLIKLYMCKQRRHCQAYVRGFVRQASIKN